MVFIFYIDSIFNQHVGMQLAGRTLRITKSLEAMAEHFVNSNYYFTVTFSVNEHKHGLAVTADVGQSPSTSDVLRRRGDENVLSSLI